MVEYGRTWWGKQWLEAFNGIDVDNRLARGRSYANRGAVRDIKIENASIKAKVQGSRSTPYRVEIILSSFSPSQTAQIRQITNHSPKFLSNLLSRQLPEELLEALERENIQIFPTKWQDIDASCSCPDWAIPCKHIAAVIYLIAAEIDKNPFTVFSLHNCDLLELIDDFSDGKLAHVQQIQTVESLFKSHQAPSLTFNSALLDALDLSVIPNLYHQIHSILSPSPLFYEKDFREALSSVYRYWMRHPGGKNLCFDHSPPSKVEDSDKTPEEIFLKNWGGIEEWPTFSIQLDFQHLSIEITNGISSLFPIKSGTSISSLILFLQSIPYSLFHKLSPNLQLLLTINHFCYKLLEHAALIPQLLQNEKNQTLIRWIPAFFDPIVNDIYRKLVSICPPDLVTYKNSLITPEEQVLAACSVLLSQYIHGVIPSILEKDCHSPIIELFFYGIPQRFTDFKTKEIPGTISLWLSRLYLSQKTHKLYLAIEECQEGFELELKVGLEEKADQLIPLKRALKTTKDQKKLSLLADLSVIWEYIPELEENISSSHTASFALDNFTDLFLNILPVLRALGITVLLPKGLKKILKPQISLKLESKGSEAHSKESFLKLTDLLNFDWKILIGDNEISIKEFQKLLKKSQGLVKIMNEYVLLDQKEMESLLKQIEKLPTQLNQAELMQGVLSGQLMGAKVSLDQHLSFLFEKLHSYHPVSIPSNLKATLRPYQERGFSWLVQNIELGFGSIIADDMGLGKTLQVIAALLHCKNAGLLKKKPVLVVAPTSLLTNWEKEIHRFAQDLNLLLYHGIHRKLDLKNCDIVITSYGLIRRDKTEFNKVNWFAVVIDEAQNIKNHTTDQTKAIKSIKADHRIAMSGTPVENRLMEYWSIFDFTNKNYLGTPKQFKEQFAIPIEKERNKTCLDSFIKITAPFIMRRLKSDRQIIQDLPEKIENNRYCNLVPEQTALYKEAVDAILKEIETSDGIARRGLVLKLINALKQICNHPSQYAKKPKALIHESGKMQMLEEIMQNIDALGEKVLIFTQYTEMGTLISNLLTERFNLEAPFLHGSLSRKDRDIMVEEFQNEVRRRILIVSLKAGGTGLNLTAASHVIHYDLWWNPAVEAQATDRAYRIGQKKNVMVYRLLTSGTFEEKIDEMIQSKKELANLAVGSGEQWITELNNAQLRDLVAIAERG